MGLWVIKKKKSRFSSRKESGFLLVKKYCNYNIQINRDFCDFQKAVLKEQIKGKKEREVAQSCTTLCDPMDRSPPGSSVHRILQASIVEWVAIPFSRESSRPRDWTWVSHIAGRFFTIWATWRSPVTHRHAHTHIHTHICMKLVWGHSYGVWGLQSSKFIEDSEKTVISKFRKHLD